MYNKDFVIAPKHKEEFELGFALYHLICGVCKDPLEWELNPDPDSLFYRTVHSGEYAPECKLIYTMYPTEVVIHIEPDTGD